MFQGLDDSLGRETIQCQNIRCRREQADNYQGMAGECFPAVDGRFGLERHSDVQLYCPEGRRDGGPDIGKLSQLHVHNLLECDAAMCAATLILEDKSPGVADGEETLSDDPKSVLEGS